MDTLPTAILAVLQNDGQISDTRQLVLPGTSRKATSQEDQLAVQGALNSLQSRDVCIIYTLYPLASNTETRDSHHR